MAGDRPVEMRPADLQLRLEIGEDEFGVLELDHGATEGLAVLHEGDRFIEGALRAGLSADGDGEPFLRQLLHQMDETAAFLPEQIVPGHAAILEEQFGGVGRMLADLVEIAPALEPGGPGIDQDQAGPLGALAGIGLGDHDHAIGVLAVGDVSLGAVDHPVVAFERGGGADALQIAARARLGHGDGGDHVARDHAGEIFGALLVGPQPLEIIGGDVVLQRETGRAAEIGQFLGDHAVEAEIEPQPAVFLGDGGAQHPRLAQRLPRLAPDDALFLVAIEIGCHVFGEDLADGAAEGFVVVAIGGAAGGIEHGSGPQAFRKPVRRWRMIWSASAMIVSIKSLQVGMSWISPATMPQDQAPASISPSIMIRG